MSIGSVITSISSAVTSLLPFAETAAGILDPGAAAIIASAATLLNDAASDIPAATAIVTKITSGQPYTDAEIDADMAAYLADYQTEVVEAEAKGATLPST